MSESYFAACEMMFIAYLDFKKHSGYAKECLKYDPKKYYKDFRQFITANGLNNG